MPLSRPLYLISDCNLEYSVDTNNILNISVFDALSIGSGLVAAVSLCIKRDAYSREVN